MFFDVILLNVFIDHILQDELDVFRWSFKFFIVDLLFFEFQFCCYLKLMPKRMHLIQKLIVFKHTLMQI